MPLVDAKRLDSPESLAALDPFRSVVVTGPHRSGTKITARILGRVGRRTVRMESQVGFDDTDIIEEELSKEGRLVHCPQWIFAGMPLATDPEVAVVYCVRNAEEVARSKGRLLYKGRTWTPKALGIESAESAATKAVAWGGADIANPFEVVFGDLDWHDLWRTAAERRDWSFNRWRG